MAEPSLQSRFSESSRGALDWALGNAEGQGRTQIEPDDLWVGVIRSHGGISPPLTLLSHFDISPEQFFRKIGYDPTGSFSRRSVGPNILDRLNPEARKINELALSFGEKFNPDEGGLVRLRDFFGALLLIPSPALKAFRQALQDDGADFNLLTKAYQEYLRLPNTISLGDFLEERFPKPAPAAGDKDGDRPDLSLQLAVSGFSADTRAARDLVGIGAEVDAFAYLMAAKALKPPLAIGLFGDWGAGKTYFMQSLKERIFRITEDARNSGKPQKDLSVYKYIVQIEFNAWHYVEGELWASMVEHILHNLQTRPGESPTLLQQRQQRLIEQMEDLRREQSLARELKKDLETNLQEKKKEIEDLKNEQESKLKELEQLKARDLLAAVELTDDDRQRLNTVLADMGANAVLGSALEFMNALERLKSELEQANALTVILRRRGWQWLLGLGAVLLSGPLISVLITLLSQSQVPAVTNALFSISAALAGLTALLKSSTAELSAMRDRVETAQARLEAGRKEKEAEFAKEIATLEKQLSETTRQYDQAVEEEQRLENEIQTLEEELQQVTPRRVLLDFIRERVESQDYRKWLGVPALIRRDFEQLSQLIQDQNDKFQLEDTGVEKNPDQINRIVLYIDDLDRCPPKRVTEVLQAVHLLLAFPLFVVVVAVDSRWLSQSLQSHYGALLGSDNGYTRNSSSLRATPQDYLEKIFQIPFWVSPLGDQARLRIIQGMVTDSRAQQPPDQEKIPTAEGATPTDGSSKPDREAQPSSTLDLSFLQPMQVYDPQAETNPNPPGLKILDPELQFMADLRALLGETPRSVKRFVNVYWLMKSIALSQVDDFISTEPFAGYRRVQFLLAILTGLPTLAHELFGLFLSGESPPAEEDRVGIPKIELDLVPGDSLRIALDKLRKQLLQRRRQGENLDFTLSELDYLKTWLEGYQEGQWLNLPASQLREWAPMAARFSYRMEEAC
jgi:hypothetical protein